VAVGESLDGLARLNDRLEDRQIVGGPVINLREEVLSGITDPATIREHLDRIARAIEDEDEAQAIGSAKELIESTAKVVLSERGQPVNDKDDLPELVRAAQLALAVHPTSALPGPDGSDAVKKILGGATTVATGIAELRNRGYGPSHGPGQPRVGLRARHARLAVAGAQDVVRIHARHPGRRRSAMENENDDRPTPGRLSGV
jgi:hypothetical protein